jgi:tRNA-splicing ligase RtcB
MDVQYPVALSGAKSSTLMWAQEHEVGAQALQQLRNIAALPWVHGVRVMPDVHLGKGGDRRFGDRDEAGGFACGRRGRHRMWHGGCAHLADRCGSAGRPGRDPVAHRGRSTGRVPGARVSRQRAEARAGRGWDRFWGSFSSLHDGVQDREKKAHQQMGSLGGGNHFIEVCLDDEDRVWLMLHSGSRNIGKELAERHMRIAKALPHNADLPDRDLAVFLSGTPEMDAYRRDLTWAQEYASRNRAVMLSLVMQAVRESFTQEITFEQPISCHHNYVAEETIDGLAVLVTRKGAIRAGRGDLGLIPGSMGTGSYVVRGLGSEQSFYSASHGAGRRMSRNEAKRRYTVDDLIAQTAGVESRKDAGVLDELPAAYKDIESVIAAQSDLVEVVAHLKQVICVKG